MSADWTGIPLAVRVTDHPDYPAWEIFRELPTPPGGPAATFIAWESFAAGYRAGVAAGTQERDAFKQLLREVLADDENHGAAYEIDTDLRERCESALKGGQSKTTV